MKTTNNEPEVSTPSLFLARIFNRNTSKGQYQKKQLDVSLAYLFPQTTILEMENAAEGNRLTKESVAPA